MSDTCRSEQRDKLAVIILCGMSLSVLGGISAGAIIVRIPNDSQTLLGVIVGGLLLFGRECLQAIRAAWSEQRTGKLTDALAAAGPPPSDSPAPADAGEAAREVADIADDKASQIERKTA